MKRKILSIIIGLFIFILGPKVYALEPSIEVEYLKNRTETVELNSERFGGLVYYVSNPQEIEIKLKGSNLVEDTNYQIVMQNIMVDNHSSNYAYATGEELTEGVTITPNLSVKIYIRPNGTENNISIGGKKVLYFFKTNPNVYDELINYYKEIANVDVYDEDRVDTISVDLYDTGYSMFGNSLIGEKLSSDSITVHSECNLVDNCKIELSKDSLFLEKKVQK